MARVVHRRSCALLVLLAATACGVSDENAAPAAPVTSNATQPTPTGGAEPLPEFLGEVRGARYGDYAGSPGAMVRDEPAFEQMRHYVLDRYGTEPVSRSYLLGDATFDCLGTAGKPPPDSRCPPGTVPVRRVTLAELTRFPTLQSFLSKTPDGGSLPPVPPPT